MSCEYSVRLLQDDLVAFYKLQPTTMRFGQFVYNERGYECVGSYECEDPQHCYILLFESLTISVNDI